MSNPTTTCGITVVATNSTGQGLITFNTFNFLQDGGFEPAGYPPVIASVLADGDTSTILEATFTQQYEQTWQGPIPAGSTSSGTATFNLPNGQALTITWDLDAWNGGDMPSIMPGSGYAVSGTTTPTYNDGYNYSFALNIAPQAAV